MPSDQGTIDQMILGSSISSQCKPKVGVLCTVSPSDVQGWTTLSKTVHKTPNLGLSCELIKEPRIIWSFVPCSGAIYIKLLIVVNSILKYFILEQG